MGNRTGPRGRRGVAGRVQRVNRHDQTATAPTLSGPFEFVDPGVSPGRLSDGGDGTVVELRYRIGSGDGPITFTERIELPFELPSTDAVHRSLRVLHLVAGVSYYKCLAPVPLVVPALSRSERALVTALYDQGLREFAYRNGIAVPLPVELVEAVGSGAESGTEAGADGSIEAEPAARPDRSAAATFQGALVPIGGGKDSALVASLVPEGRLFAVNPVGAQEHLAVALGRPLLGVRRILDPRLRDLVARGVPNGHVPVTAITSAIAVVVAASLGVRDVVMGIERSADEPSLVTGDGVPVNHQFSKSSEAEALLRAVFDPTGVRYFSLLRPLTELAIGAAVARRGLGDDIVSCNKVFTVWNESTASREQRPCGECAKCLFTALMLAPASSPDAVARQYGGALLDDPGHVEPVRDLWSEAKPFDCVGERLESAAAVALLGRIAGWSDQVVVRALGGEAGDLLRSAQVDPASFLEVGPVEGLPEEYRALVTGLSAELAEVPGLVRAPR